MGYRVVVNVGRLTIQKGLPNLLRAAQKVVQQHPKTLFLIVGSGEQYYELIELAAELGIGQMSCSPASNAVKTGGTPLLSAICLSCRRFPSPLA